MITLRKNYLEKGPGFVVVDNFWNPKYSMEQGKNGLLVLSQLFGGLMPQMAATGLLVKEVKDSHGSIDGVLHAIAFSPTEAMGGNFMNTELDDAVASFEVSAFSLKTLAKGFQPIMNNPSSIVALDFDNSQAWPGYDWQGVAKSGLQSIVRYLAYYLGKDGIRVNAVASGPLATTAAKNIPGFTSMEGEWDKKAPLGWDTKNAEPVAKVVNFLLSDLSEAVTGEVIHADGGAHAIGGTMLED